jgi:hypothetical protein
MVELFDEYPLLLVAVEVLLPLLLVVLIIIRARPPKSHAARKAGGARKVSVAPAPRADLPARPGDGGNQD